MAVKHVVVKYYSRQMLLTVDVHTLLSILFDTYGDNLTVEFVKMGENERNEATDNSTAIPSVIDRFQVFEMQQATGIRRRPDIELAAIRAGIK